MWTREGIRGEVPFAAGRGTAWRENKKKGGLGWEGMLNIWYLVFA